MDGCFKEPEELNNTHSAAAFGKSREELMGGLRNR